MYCALRYKRALHSKRRELEKQQAEVAAPTSNMTPGATTSSAAGGGAVGAQNNDDLDGNRDSIANEGKCDSCA